MKYNIRIATENDFEKLIILFEEFALFEKVPEKMLNTAERMRAEKDFFNCFVAENSENEIVGYAIFFFFYLSWSGKSLYMDDLYVKEKFRGEGIGTDLINNVIFFAKENNCHKLRWQVSNWNEKAINFYKKIGAEIDEDERNCNLIV
ncbi:GNAT family N-acetyltransferase [Paludibacter sp. 221]|uniref:GNAT family N-acetyltransferase n=1 Tax=Paludibacter sp. 221 TaxID=2302939 RepID=UPI0013D639B3|nr:GNAT family N-acetyltransferase [Paludibacter sp. 221]NDV47300.1 GNAT family N-acetyltransferase [Paludibacter sp. 221]